MSLLAFRQKLNKFMSEDFLATYVDGKIDDSVFHNNFREARGKRILIFKDLIMILHFIYK